MLEPPKNRREAQKQRYNVWGGNPKGHPYDPERCAYEVMESGRGALFYQCSNKPGKGPDGIFCGTHSPEAIARRAAKQEARYQAERDRWARIHQRADDRCEMEEILVELAKWMASNRELVEADEWLRQIAERMAANGRLQEQLAK